MLLERRSTHPFVLTLCVSALLIANQRWLTLSCASVLVGKTSHALSEETYVSPVL